MYVLKNALRSIGRSKGRNVLIGTIALVIAVSACLGLSIRQASDSARESALESMSVTATISYDRQSMMNGMMGGGMFDRDQFQNMMGGMSSLTLDEYKKYAEAESVDGFYYTLTAYLNGSETFEPVTTDGSSSDDPENEISGKFPSFPGNMMGGGRMSSGDFTIVGYSSDSAMTEFINGVATILDGGQMFEEGTSEYSCVISEELALYNEIAVGDVIELVNPLLETEIYELTVTGIYSSSETNDFSSMMFGGGQDPANKIYMSSNALALIIDNSEANSTTITDEDTGREQESALSSTLSATYVFDDTDGYYAFEKEVRTLGLDDSYTVSSTDLTAFENSLVPLNTLGTMAGWFLLVILLIGAVILVVLNIFNVRERKYEVGVLTAMGMKKSKVACQFVCEILVVTMVAILVGALIGAVSSVPVTNALLENQIANQSSFGDKLDQNFGRPDNIGGGMGGFPSGMPSDRPGNIGGGKDFFGDMFGGAANYVSEVNSAMDLTVVLQMLGIGLVLTLIASAASVLFIMRYDPLKILANRD